MSDVREGPRRETREKIAGRPRTQLAVSFCFDALIADFRRSQDAAIGTSSPITGSNARRRSLGPPSNVPDQLLRHGEVLPASATMLLPMHEFADKVWALVRAITGRVGMSNAIRNSSRIRTFPK
jgi:hypothetical protein